MYWSRRRRPATAGLRIEFDRFYPNNNWFNDFNLSLSLSLFGYKEEKLVCIVTRFFNDAWCIAIPRDYLSIRESNFPARISRYVFMSRIIFHGSSLFGLSSRARNSDELSIVEQTCVCRSRRRYWQPCLLQSIVHCPADDRYFTKGN